MKPMKLVTQDGKNVFYNKFHLEAHADVVEYLEEAVRRIDSQDEPFIKVLDHVEADGFCDFPQFIKLRCTVRWLHATRK